MKLIEAMKKVKANREKVADLQAKIGQHCANTSLETPMYGERTGAQIEEWIQSCFDTNRESVKLLTAISRTNLATPVTIDLGEQAVTKSIAEWVWRRREFSAIDLATFQKLGDRGLREGSAPTSTGVPLVVTIRRWFDPVWRDKNTAVFASEPHKIDSALEVANAVTDLIEE